MKKSILYALPVIFSSVFISCETKKSDDSKAIAEDQNAENLDDRDEKNASEFAVAAADGGLLEVQLGTLALTKAASPQVKQFAQMMVDDHTKANNELKAIASQKNIVLPDVMSEKHQKKYYDLDQKKGADFDKDYFDKDYMDLMVKDHKDDIDKFEKEADKGNDPEIKSWAAGKLTTLRHHLEEAERIHDGLKNSAN